MVCSFHCQAVAISAFYDAFHEDDLCTQDELASLLAYLSKMDEDTMYFNQAMTVPD